MVKIIIEEKEYTFEEAKKLYEALEKIFGEKRIIYQEGQKNYPWYTDKITSGTPIDPYIYITSSCSL